MNQKRKSVDGGQGDAMLPQPKLRKMSKRMKRLTFQVVVEGNVETLKRLMAAKFNIDLVMDRDEAGQSYIHRVVSECTSPAVFSKLMPMIVFLHLNGCRTGRVTNVQGETALLWACKNPCCFELLNFLVAYSWWDIVVCDQQGNSPLHLFISNVQLQASSLDGDSTSRRFSVSQCVTIVKSLVDQISKKELNAENSDGKSLLFLVLQRQDVSPNWITSIANIIIAKGVKLHASNKDHALKYIKSLLLIEQIANLPRNNCINRKDANGWNPLHHVFVATDMSLIIKHDALNMMINKGAVVEDRTNPILLATMAKCGERIMRKLKNRYPNATANAVPVEQESALFSVISNPGETYEKKAEKMWELIENGADPCETQLCKDNDEDDDKDDDDDNEDDDEDDNEYDDEDANEDDEEDDNKNGYREVRKQRVKSVLSMMCGFIMKGEEQWMQLLKYFLQLPQFTESVPSHKLTHIYLNLILDLLHSFKAENHQITEDLLTLLVQSNKSIIDITQEFNAENVTYDEQNFGVMVLDPISYLIARDKMEEVENLLDFIKIMLKAGFTVSKTADNCITPLTALLIFKNIQDTGNKEMAQLFIDSGVDVTSTGLSMSVIHEHYSDNSICLNKFILKVPDALFMILLQEEADKDLMKILLSHWWAPPLALFASHPLLSDTLLDSNFGVVNAFNLYLPLLASYGGIPHGTMALEFFKGIMNTWQEKIARDNRQELVEQFQAHVDAVNQVIGTTPMPLLMLCKYQLREDALYKAEKQGVSLPCLLRRVVPQYLHSVVIH